MDIGGVTDGDMVAEEARMVVGEVQDGVVLNVGAAADSMRLMSPRSTAPYQTLDSSPRVTSPTTTAVLAK